MQRRTSLFLALAIGFALPAVPAHAEVPLPADTVLTVPGRGWGHGRGMGQWGAKGLADQGTSYQDILTHYYSSVTLGTRAAELIKVLVEASPEVIVTSDSPFVVRWSDHEVATTTDPAEPFWKVTFNGTNYVLASAGSHTGPWRQIFSDARYPYFVPQTDLLEVVFGNGTVRQYRGNIIARYAVVDGMRTINNLLVEEYLRGVVPLESPSSWPAEALKAQAVAARTYATNKRDGARSRGNTFDICATTSCQVYGGAAQRSKPGATVLPIEKASTDSAISATAGVMVNYSSAPILAEFSSSTGGYTAPGSVPYQKAVPDPTDSVSPHHSWTAQIGVTEIEDKWPELGRLVRLNVVERNGFGDWGGRVNTLRLVGTETSVDVSGDAFRSAFSWPSKSNGIRSNWFSVGIRAAELVAAPTSVSLPKGSTKALTFTYKNRGTEAWSVGGDVVLTTDSGSAFKHSSWPSGTIVARIAANQTSPGSSLITEDQVARFDVELDGTSASLGSHRFNLKLLDDVGTQMDALTVNVEVVASWIESSPNLLSNGSFEKGLWSWDAEGATSINELGRDLTPAVRLGSGPTEVSQTLNFAGGKSRRFHWGAWTSKTGSGSLTILATVKFVGGVRHQKTLRIPTGEHAWTYTEQQFVTSPTRELESIRLRVVSDLQGGAVGLADAIRLTEGPIANASFETGLGPWTTPDPPAEAPFARQATWTASDGASALVLPGRAETVASEQLLAFTAPAWERVHFSFDHRSYQTTPDVGTWIAQLTLNHEESEPTVLSIPIPVAQHPFERLSAEIVAKEPTISATVRFEASGQTGNMYIDAVRLVRSRVVDASFESVDFGWTQGGLQGDDGVRTFAAREGPMGLRLQGPDRSFATQTLVLRGTSSRKFRLGAWTNSSRASKGRRDVTLTFFHTDGTKSFKKLDFSGSDHAWKYSEALVWSAKKFDGVRVAVMLEGATGWGSFDGITLTDA